MNTNTTNPIGNMDTSSFGAGRVETQNERLFRWLEKPDGTKVLQVASSWRQGSTGGVEWRDIPTVRE